MTTYDKAGFYDDNDMIMMIVWDPTAHCAIHQDWAREACFPMLSSICLELTTFIHQNQRLSGDLRMSEAKNLLFFVYLSTVAYTSDLITFLPASLKLRPYGCL